MHTAKYLEVEASYKNCHTDIYFKIQSYAPIPVAVSNASKPELLQSLSLMLSFCRTTVEHIDQVKSNLS